MAELGTQEVHKFEIAENQASNSDADDIDDKNEVAANIYKNV